MHSINHILSEFDFPTNKLRIGALRAYLPRLQEHCKYQKHSVEFRNDVLDELWKHMNADTINIKCQMLCAIYFYTILAETDNKEVYLNEILRIVNNEIHVRENTSNTSLAVSLVNGMFQSSFFDKISSKSETMEQILAAVFEFLLLLGYKYSEHTILAFKTLSSFRKILGTQFQKDLFSEEKIIKLLNLTNHNWENPTSGVRDSNKAVFQIVLSVMDASMCESVLEEINAFYWNKAKYLMISEFMKSCSSILNLKHMKEWVDGLLYSLNKPGLVSAGADMYYALLKNLNHENEWCDLFLTKIINVFINQPKKSIENFTNYWCLITLGKFPSLMQVLIDELENKGNSDLVKYSILCVLKQGNKKGLYNKKLDSIEVNVDNIDDLIVKALDDCDPMTRMLAFDIVCVSSHKVIPNQIECGFVLSYLNNNINSDCAVLRIGMVNSLNIFLMRIHKYFINCLKKNEEDEIKRILQFCNELQEMLFVSLNFNGNYQRKITVIKVCDAILSAFGKMPDKPKFLVVHFPETLEKYLKSGSDGIMYTECFLLKLIELLKDPAEDIRMSVVKLILNHCSSEIKKTRILNNIIEDALLSINNKFFYQINCGQSMFKLIVSVLVKEKFLEAKFKTVEDIFKFSCNELKSEYILKRDILESIELGRQLHSFVSILQVVIEVCLENSYRMEVASDDILELIDILEAISKQFSWEEDGTTSSDFSKMSDMIESIIAKSNYSDNYTNDESKISGLHQIVLNSLWLNVKASCDVSAVLIQYHKNDVDPTICKKCLDIIINVLETSRHKGAIEAAGAALGQSIRYLTSLPETSGVSHIPRELLQCKLKELISETSRMSSVTRRGAGLSIMVHRIVSNDTEEGKPLFHYFINAVLETCGSSKDESRETSYSDVEKDLPKAIYIHFLTRIVMDSTLASDVLYYAANLAELAFDNLTSIHWQIRNAALQLYGALVPKLIGQKKASGMDNNTIATVACDEFRLHFPKLWIYMTNQLQNNNCINVLQYHNNLIPILNIMASFARRYNFSSDLVQQKSSDDKLLKDLLKFLGSPIYTVRRLSAKCIFNIFTFEEIHCTLMRHDVASDNFLHGCLMLTANCHEQYNNAFYKKYFSKLKEKYTRVMNLRKHSYLSKLCFENVFDESNNFDIHNLNKILNEVKFNIYAPGVHVWAETLVKKYIKSAPWESVPDILKLLLDENCFEKHGESLLEKIERDKNIQEYILKQMFDLLFTYKHKFNCDILWQILYTISANIKFSKTIDISDLIQYLESHECIYKIRYILPFLTQICVTFKYDDVLINISKRLLSMSNPETTDFEMRFITAIANNEIAKRLNTLPDTIVINSIVTAVILLQDEDEDIRNESVNFYKNFCKMEAPHPYICLQNILNCKFLNDFSNKSEIGINICNSLSSILLNTPQDICNQYNPFANSSKNIYLEVEVVKKLIENFNDT